MGRCFRTLTLVKTASLVPLFAVVEQPQNAYLDDTTGLSDVANAAAAKACLIVTIVTIRTFDTGVATLPDAPTGEFYPTSTITHVIVNDSSE